MAQPELDREAFSCAICLDLLNNPVTIPCGHSYCMNCIQSNWDNEVGKRLYSCPQCRHSFAKRPVLVKSTMLSTLVEELKKSGLQEGCAAGPDDVSCDVCSGRKLKAVKSCLQCLVSYCERHLQPHNNVAVLQKHQLVAPCTNLQDSLCSEHNKVKEMFCRTEQKSICHLCSMETHKGHDLTSAASERSQRQPVLESTRHKILHKIQAKEIDMKLLEQEALSIGCSANEAVRFSGDSFTRLTDLLEKRRTEVELEIRSQQKTQEARVQELQDQVQRNITELRETLDQLDSLILTPDHNQFLQHYQSLLKAGEVTGSVPIWGSPRPCFKEVMDTVLAFNEKLEQTLNEDTEHISLALSRVQFLVPQFKFPTREDFLQYSKEITLDPNTAHTKLSLSDGNKSVKFTGINYKYPKHRDRFSEWRQVLSREGLVGRSYWEVEIQPGGTEQCCIAITYRGIKRKGHSNKLQFGHNNNSWALHVADDSCCFFFNNVKSSLPIPDSSRIGVYLDHTAGALSFYSVSQTITLLHTVSTTFTQPLFVGVGFLASLAVGSTAYFPTLTN